MRERDGSVLDNVPSAISLPRSPHPTYIMMSLFENLEIACEITVLPAPNAPGMAVVPP